MLNSKNDDKIPKATSVNSLGFPTSTVFDEDEFLITESDRLTKLPYTSPHFRTNLYTITFVVDGYGRYSSNTVSFPITPNLLYFNNPGELLQLEWNSMSRIHQFCFSEGFILKYAGIHLYKMFPFLLFETVLPKDIDLKIYANLCEICTKIECEYKTNSPYKKNVLANLLVRLLLKIKEIVLTNMQTTSNKRQDILLNFLCNMECHYEQLWLGKVRQQLRVRDYAAKQNLHENYFSNIIKTKSGKTPNQWIAEKTILIAVRMVEDSTFSIKEIAYRIGFQHPSHFTAFFKKATGLSPIDYRKKQEDAA